MRERGESSHTLAWAGHRGGVSNAPAAPILSSHCLADVRFVDVLASAHHLLRKHPAHPTQAYVDHLVGTGHCTRAIILGLDGSTWAASPNASIKPDEAKRLISAFNGTAKPSIYELGLTFAGTLYMTLRADARSIYSKKGATGICAVKSAQCVLLGFYNENIQPGQCVTTVERLGDYLMENGF